MKLAIIAAAILSSSAAFAGSANLYFGGEQTPDLTINVVKENAPLFFSYNDMINPDNYAEVEIKSNFVSKLKVSSTGTWTDTKAWGGTEPETVIHTTVDGANIVQNGFTHDGKDFSEEHVMDGRNDQSANFLMGVQAAPMTHAGTARLDAVVQFEYE